MSQNAVALLVVFEPLDVSRDDDRVRVQHGVDIDELLLHAREGIERLDDPPLQLRHTRSRYWYGRLSGVDFRLNYRLRLYEGSSGRRACPRV